MQPVGASAPTPDSEATQAAGYASQKVVYHVNSGDPKLLKGVLGNIRNHINAVGQGRIEIIVVMHGDGLSLLRLANQDTHMQKAIDGLRVQEVRFSVCNNTLVGADINYKTDLYRVSESDIVPSGVAQIAKLQQEGYAYIKP